MYSTYIPLLKAESIMKCKLSDIMFRKMPRENIVNLKLKYDLLFIHAKTKDVIYPYEITKYSTIKYNKKTRKIGDHTIYKSQKEFDLRSTVVKTGNTIKERNLNVNSFLISKLYDINSVEESIEIKFSSLFRINNYDSDDDIDVYRVAKHNKHIIRKIFRKYSID